MEMRHQYPLKKEVGSTSEPAWTLQEREEFFYLAGNQILIVCSLWRLVNGRILKKYYY
jgi:hypothetical protein